MKKNKLKKIDQDGNYPMLLLLIYGLLFVFLAVDPVDRVTWYAENTVAVITLLVIVMLYQLRVRFSNTAYSFMALFLILQTIGGHYTFEKVPFDFVTDTFGFERNHYDRVCHFLVGFFAFPALEFFEGHKLIKNRVAAGFLIIMSIFGFAAIFEIIEYLYALYSAPEAGEAFLGSQGDIWDAQRDMLCDGLGAMAATLLYAVLRWRKPARKK